MSSPPTGTVTFLFTDIEGSTAMWERDARRMQLALARHDEILKGAVGAHGGFIFKMVGDACCAAFATAPRALEAALSVQRAIFSEPWDDRCRVRVRMALHTGSAEEREGDYFGPPVNRVARLLSAGHGGQILLSRVTEEVARDWLPEGALLRDMGEHRLKDLTHSERIFQLTVPDLPSEFPLLKTVEAPSEDDRYRLIKKLGSGGMAEVYLAYDEMLEREVAFKVLDRKHAENREAVERFRREARSAASLHHPNIVSIHDRGETEDGTYYLVMEYMEGGTLEDLIKREGPLPAQSATEVALEVARALQAAHERGVIHRDIKPQNILLSEVGEAKVADFGIARAAAATTMTHAGSVLGTVHYISPEQALGESVTPTSDLYSLGVVLYEMLTGELPYDTDTPAGIVMKHVSGLSRSPKEANPEVPEELDAVTARLLARDPEDRYPDATALAEDLERAKEGLPPTAETMRARTRARRAGRLQRRGVLAALALVLVSIGVIAAVALTLGLPTGTGQDGPSAKGAGTPALEGNELPEVGNIPPGKYVADEFNPEMSFTLDEGWQIGTQTPEVLYLAAPDIGAPPEGEPDPGPPSLSFVNPNKVYKPFDPTADEQLLPTPKDMTAWIRNHPELKVEKSQPVTLGGVPGTQFDVSVVAQNGGDVALFRVADQDFFLANEKESRIIVLEDVGGDKVAIVIEGTRDELEAFLPEAQKVLDTVRFAGVPADSGASKPRDATAAGISTQTISTEGPIAPGKYHSDEFEPAVSFSVGKGWMPYGEELPDALAMTLSNTKELERPSTFGFYSPRRVVDQSDPDRNTLEPAPESVDGWVEWFQKHPNLKTEEPVPVTVGGASGVQIDAVVSSEPKESQFPPSFWVLSTDLIFYDFVGARSRTTILNVGGNTVLIDTSASSQEKFEELFPKAQEVLDTVEWKDAS